MKSNRKYLLVAIIPLFAFVLSGCGKQTAQTTPQPQVAAQQSPATTQSQTLQDQAQQAAQAAPALEPLPADNKQAIDAEITNIDKELQTTTDTSATTDLSNASLGL